MLSGHHAVGDLPLDELMDLGAGDDDHPTPSTYPGAPAGSRGADIAYLTQAWINEKCAPELLPFAQGTVDSLVEGIEAQVRESTVGAVVARQVHILTTPPPPPPR
jgi:hypothetical protein